MHVCCILFSLFIDHSEISEIKMQQSVPMGQISEINMQQTFHVLQYTVARPVVENLKYWFRASLRR